MGKGAKKLDQGKSSSTLENMLNDPRFDTLARREKKVKIDKRFKEMLTSDKFATKSKMDMRGRRINIGSKNALSSLYELKSDESEKSEVSDTEDNEQPIKLDLARGLGNITSSDEDSGSEWSFEEDDEEEHAWGETDRDARRVDWTSSRLALCNMEWDRISAADIFCLISSFEPPGTPAVLSITVYVSEFGKKRIKEEEVSGPKLSKLKKPMKNDKEMDKRTREALRAYQLERMKYYYAIIECDSVQTATAIYDACDGIEFESSAVRLDLRFVPDDMVFEESAIKERVTREEVDLDNVKPKYFESAALSKSSAKLTWEDTDPERIQVHREAFLPDADLDQMQHLIAPCSSDEEDVERKRLELLNTVDNEGGSRPDKDILTVTWGPDLGETNEKKKDPAEPTPWERYLERRKTKRKERKAMIAEFKKRRKEEEESVLAEEKPSRKMAKSVKKYKTDDTSFVEDQRFAALYNNSAFAIDPSHPLYKSSQLALKQASEKQKRKEIRSTNGDVDTLIHALKKKTKRSKE